MENNAQGKLVTLTAYIFFLIIVGGCVTKNVIKPKSRTKSATIETGYPNMNLINSKLVQLDTLGCGKVNTSCEWLGQVLVSNGELFDCLKKNEETAQMLRKVLCEITPLVDFEANLHFVNFISEIKDYGDPDFFALYVELLKNDWHPGYDLNASIHYAPVNEYVNNFLIEPHIKSIDGKTYQEYINEDAANRHFHVISTEEYYQQIKELWESGRITLTSEE